MRLISCDGSISLDVERVVLVRDEKVIYAKDGTVTYVMARYEDEIKTMDVWDEMHRALEYGESTFSLQQCLF